MKFNVYPQHPKPSNHGICGELNIDEIGRAYLLSDKNLSMTRVRLIKMASHGFLLSGMEEIKSGKYRYQEWWCIPPFQFSNPFIQKAKGKRE